MCASTRGLRLNLEERKECKVHQIKGIGERGRMWAAGRGIRSMQVHNRYDNFF
jgi:hypothetical protein